MHRDIPKQHRRFARAMRIDATPAEGRLWQVLRGRQLEGHKFRRQVPLDGYILDFVCFEARLIIELDGHQHAMSARDEKRDAWFRSQDFRILRFWNGDIDKNLDGVCLTILSELRNRGA